MEITSILTSTKKILNIGADDDAFDLDVITFINTVLAILSDIGLGSFMIHDDSFKWEDLGLTQDQTNLLKTYVFLKVRMLFDPPSMSFVIDAMNKQIDQYEWRLSASREEALHPLVVDPNTNIGTAYPNQTPQEEPV